MWNAAGNAIGAYGGMGGFGDQYTKFFQQRGGF
jgi:hypothetical protein